MSRAAYPVHRSEDEENPPAKARLSLARHDRTSFATQLVWESRDVHELGTPDGANVEQGSGSHADLLDHQDPLDDRRRDRRRLSRGACRPWRQLDGPVHGEPSNCRADPATTDTPLCPLDLLAHRG